MASTAKPPRPAASNGHAPARKSVIEEGTSFKGAINASSPVLVRGTFEGEITGAAVEIDRGGVMLGKAKVSELRCRGEMGGEFEAENVEIGGRVRDKTIIRARSLLVAPGADQEAHAPLFGECQLEVGDPPSKEQAIKQALGHARAAEAGARVAPPVVVDTRVPAVVMAPGAERPTPARVPPPVPEPRPS